jgi:putative CocE/NonD family hydrolase
MTGHTAVVERDVDVVMRDGVVLRADVYRPEGPGPYPTLLQRTPYGKNHYWFTTACLIRPLEAVARGFAVVIQDCRGSSTSEGLLTPLSCEADDGYDTVEWAAQQSWSNGSIATYGSSYMGVTALQAALARPPHLTAVVGYVTGANYEDGFVRSGGAFELLFALGWVTRRGLERIRRLDPSTPQRTEALERLQWISDHMAEACATVPLEDVLGPAAQFLPHWRDWMEHDTYDEFWRAMDVTVDFADSGISLLSIGGWYDQLLKGHLDLQEVVETARAAGQEVDANLVIGPWEHNSYLSLLGSYAGDAFFGESAGSGTPGLERSVLDWLEPRLTGLPPAEQAPVRYFVMGADEWRTSPVWPPSHAALELRLGDQGALTADAPAAGTISWVHDPFDPVPTVGGRHLGTWYGRAGVLDQATVEQRDDVLVFSTEPLTEPLTVVGDVRAMLRVSSDAPSADFTAKLVDVRPDGYCANIAEAITRVRAGDTALGTAPVDVEVDLWATAHEFGVGHRVRVEIASSNYPRFDVNGGAPVRATSAPRDTWRTARQTIHVGGPDGSRIVLGLES